jgi:hypothetical protein
MACKWWPFDLHKLRSGQVFDRRRNDCSVTRRCRQLFGLFGRNMVQRGGRCLHRLLCWNIFGRPRDGGELPRCHRKVFGVSSKWNLEWPGKWKLHHRVPRGTMERYFRVWGMHRLRRWQVYIGRRDRGEFSRFHRRLFGMPGREVDGAYRRRQLLIYRMELRGVVTTDCWSVQCDKRLHNDEHGGVVVWRSRDYWPAQLDNDYSEGSLVATNRTRVSKYRRVLAQLPQLPRAANYK